jgi:hypothetical protein
MPGLIKMALNLGKEIVNAASSTIKTGKTLSDEDITQKRRDICSKCEYLIKEDLRCSVCGCYLQFKTKVAAAKCPKGKW